MNKKVLLVGGLIVLLGGFFVYEKFIPSQQVATPIVVMQQTPPSGGSTPPPQSTTPPPPTSTGLKSGTYAGDVVNGFYGTSQAEVIISGGQITDIQFLQYPQGRMASMQRSNMAMMGIKQEIMQAQSANVNTISGATETSASFIQSIASAIVKASV